MATPLTDFTPPETYQGRTGGLYGNYQNDCPYRADVQAISDTIDPVMLAIGFSNPMHKFEAFIPKAIAANPNLTLINGAKGAYDAERWMAEETAWNGVAQSVAASGATPRILWMEMAYHIGRKFGNQGSTFPEHSDSLVDKMIEILNKAKTIYPNLDLCYLSSRSYGGWITNMGNPEPYAYENAFTVRSLIQRQQNGDPGLVPSKSPLLLWGPYLWADGTTPRADGFAWARGDYDSHGIHQTATGEDKASDLMMDFFGSESWFNGGVTPPPPPVDEVRDAYLAFREVMDRHY